jgi:hypothetical protein
MFSPGCVQNTAKRFFMIRLNDNKAGFGKHIDGGDPETPSGEYPNSYASLPPNVKSALCPHTGLRHAHLGKLLKPGGLAAAHVRTVMLRQPGARHGKTLFHVGDMLRWLDGLAAQQATQGPPIE